MKKHLAVNTLVALAFIISGPVLDKCGDWADSFSLGAEMALGMLLPLVLAFFILFTIFSVAFSLFKAVVMKDIKQVVPILVLVGAVAIYVALATPDSFWVSVIKLFNA